MFRAKAALLYTIYLACLGLGFYEFTAKTPSWLVADLPGRHVAVHAESSVQWDRPTGIFPLDKLVHEGREAMIFYRGIAGFDQRRGPALSLRSSRSFNSPR